MKEKIAGISALIAAAFASVCCIGPIVLLGLGLGGAGLAASLTEYRPLFIGLTALFMGLAFTFVYRRREVECEDGSCKIRSGSKAMKIILWGIAFGAIVMVSFPGWSPLLSAHNKQAIPKDAQLIAMKISGMTCPACAIGIEKSLNELSRVYSVSIDQETEKAKIYISQGDDLDEELVKAIEKAGPYSAEILRGER